MNERSECQGCERVLFFMCARFRSYVLVYEFSIAWYKCCTCVVNFSNVSCGVNDPSLVRDCVWIAFLVLRVGVSPNHCLSFLAASPLTVCMCLISMVPRSISLLSLVVNAVYVWWGSRGPRATIAETLPVNSC